ncbi:MAG TPA: trehalose-phosphatase [Rhodoblastus sp.]|nr:trehalose-phosphatase [Rhodoblastus sp.]
MQRARLGPAGLLKELANGGENLALFLDFDGTLVDIAPTPDAALAPPGLPELLRRLSNSLGGALAVVSGRGIADIDHRLQPFRGRAAGVHGAEIRIDPQGAVRHKARLDPSILAAVQRIAAVDPRLPARPLRQSLGAIGQRPAPRPVPEFFAMQQRRRSRRLPDQ